MSNMKPAGYLNKFTGMIWNPEQQPGAESEPEIYEPLVRLSDVHGLVAECEALKERNRNNLKFIAEELGDPEFRAESVRTPNTDAFTKELRAQGVDEFAAHKREIAAGYKRNGCEESWVDDAEDCALGADLFAANLRAGRKG